MRALLQRTELSRTIAAVSKVVDTRNTIPLLSHVLLKFDGETLDMCATDLDIEATGWAGLLEYSCDSESPSIVTVAVPGRDFADIVKRMTCDTVTLELVDQWLHIRGGRSRFKLPTLTGDSFPRMSSVGDTVAFQADLAALTSRVAFAVGSSERFMLEGVFLHSDGVLAAVATDGKRLIRAEGEETEEFDGVILPPKLLANLPSGTVWVMIGSNLIMVQQGQLCITSKLLAGKYPDYQRFWPTDHDYVVTVDRQALKAAAERVAALSDEDIGRGVRVEAVPGALILTVRSGYRGEAIEEVPAEYAGEPYDVGFAVQSFNQMLSAIPGQSLQIAIGGKTGANFNGDPGVYGCLMYFDLGKAA